MAKTVTPKPMPTTGMPDRVGSPSPPMNQKAGVTFGKMSVNPGKPPSEPSEQK